MANIFGIEVSGDTYDIEDSQARQDIQTNAQDIDGIEGKIPASASTTNKLVVESEIGSWRFVRKVTESIPIDTTKNITVEHATGKQIVAVGACAVGPNNHWESNAFITDVSISASGDAIIQIRTYNLGTDYAQPYSLSLFVLEV